MTTTDTISPRRRWARPSGSLLMAPIALLVLICQLDHLQAKPQPEQNLQHQQPSNPPTRPFAHLVSASISNHYTTSTSNINQSPRTLTAPLDSLSRNSNNNNLVDSATASASLLSLSPSSPSTSQVAQSLPLLWQAPSQPLLATPDLDNVIESTTTSQIAGTNKVIGANSLTLAYSGACQLPPTWTGRWYQSNKDPIRITNTEISDKGLCRDQKGDKFLFEQVSNNRNQASSCLVCLVINERHLNVLQYKESSCQPIPPRLRQNRTFSADSNNVMDPSNDHSLLDTVCSDITGDAQLESLFRLDTPSIECPISGQYSFTYDACREPQSSLDSCIDKRHLNFKFAACPDVPGSESKSEVLKCYADWSEGNNYYMIGRLENTSNKQDKGKFRCFIYERSSDGKIIQMAQSLEESCYGLINANEGPKTLRLTSKPPPSGNHKCKFPAYIQDKSDNWLSVDNSLIYMFDSNSTKYSVKETKEGTVTEEGTCIQQFPATNPASLQASNVNAQQHPHSFHNGGAPLHHLGRAPMSQAISSNHRRLSATSSGADQSAAQKQLASRQATSASDFVYLVQITKGCQTTNYCVRFHKRSNGIVQIDYFVTSPSDHQCWSAYHATPQTQIITSTNLEHQRCPFEGAFTLEGNLESDLTYNPSNIFICPRQSYLTAQCEHPSVLRVHSRCSASTKLVKNLYCLGSWTSNGLVRLLLADDGRQRYSAWFRDQQVPASIDLQVGLITPSPVAAKPTLVRLTRRAQCSELLSPPAGPFSLQSASPYAAPGSGAPAAISHPDLLVGLLLALATSIYYLQLSSAASSFGVQLWWCRARSRVAC